MAARETQPFAVPARGALLLAALLAAACAPELPIGEGPIELSPAVQEGFTDFQRANEPLYFAISTDGETYGYITCTSPAPCNPADARGTALQLCEQAANGVSCRIYADWTGVLWDGPTTLAPVPTPASE